MTNQEKKAWLRRYTNLDRQINARLDELAMWRSRATKVTPEYTDMPNAPQGKSDRLQEAVDHICRIEDEINADIDRLVAIREEVQAAIDAVADERLRLLLRYRYIGGMRWEQVAVKMEVSWQHVHRMHSRSLDVIECDTFL